MINFLFIALVALVVCYGIVKRPGMVLAYALFAQQLNSVLFEEANLFQYRYALPMCGLIGVHIFHFRRKQFKANLHNLFNSSILQGFLVFSAYVLIYALSIGGAYEIGYLIKYIFPGFVMVLIGALMIYRYDMFKDIVFGLVLFTIFTMLHVQLVGGSLGYDFSATDRHLLAEETGVGAITQGRMAGSLALVCILMALMKRSERAATIMLAMFAVAVVWMAMIGTRGALVSLLSALFLYLMVSRSKSRSVRRIAIFAFFVMPILISFGIMETLLVERTKELFEPGEVGSLKRVERVYVVAESMFDHFVIGLGPGGWSKFIWEGVNPRPYPHNIFLEAQIEYGVVGLILILLIVFSGLRMTIKMCSDAAAAPELRILSLLWVYYFVSTMFSGSLIQGNALFFALTGVLGAGYSWYVVAKNMRRIYWVPLEGQSNPLVAPPGKTRSKPGLLDSGIGPVGKTPGSRA